MVGLVVQADLLTCAQLYLARPPQRDYGQVEEQEQEQQQHWQEQEQEEAQDLALYLKYFCQEEEEEDLFFEVDSDDHGEVRATKPCYDASGSWTRHSCGGRSN
jgi:hypothetical protein